MTSKPTRAAIRATSLVEKTSAAAAAVTCGLMFVVTWAKAAPAS
jgi:hypothetical protein